MRPLGLDRAQPGVALARTVYDIDGNALLQRGQLLTAENCAGLAKHGVRTVYIEARHTDDITISDVIDDGTRIAAIKLMGRVLRELRDYSSDTYELPILELKRISNDIVDQLRRVRNLTVNSADLKNLENYTAAHSVNTAVLSVIIGLKASLQIEQLYDLALGAILHDLGKARIPPEVLDKPGKLTREEFDIMKFHAEAGYRVVSRHRDIPSPAAIIAMQHHEKCNANGYPRGLARDRIHDYARIAAVADVFDALSSDRVYKKRMLPHLALRIISGADSTHFDERFVKLFVDNVVSYPPGTLVSISSGDCGIVTGPGTRNLHLPVVRILRARSGLEVAKPYEVDLSVFTTYAVTDILEDL